MLTSKAALHCPLPVWLYYLLIAARSARVFAVSDAVLVDIEDTVVLATVVGSKTAKPGQDFFPLTVDYIEKT